jgi:methionyl-tRNA formyltransferase
VRILYLGLPLGAIALRRAGHRLDTVLLGHPEAPGARYVRRRLGREGTLVLGRPSLASPEVLALLASRRCDVILSFFWPRRIPPEVLALAPRGAFGTHPSILPALRGPDPYFWALRLGYRETGVTLHRLEADYDTGAIIETRAVAITPRHDAFSLARTLDRPALTLLVEAATRLARGEALEGVPQPKEGVSYAPMPDEEELSVDWLEPAEDIVQLVRACAPEPGARARLGEHEVDILAARVAVVTAPRVLAPSEAYLSEEGVTVVAGEGAVVLEKVRGEDGDLVAPESLLALSRA